MPESRRKCRKKPLFCPESPLDGIRVMGRATAMMGLTMGAWSYLLIKAVYVWLA
jgi:hypothetical protein